MGQTFGQTRDGQEAFLYEICNSNGMEIVLTDFGATVVRLLVPDKHGAKRDVVLGYDTLREYEKFWPGCFGAIVGRNCNRIAGAKMEIDGVTYALDPNDHGNTLHSGFDGWNKRIWKVREHTKDSVTFTLASAHLDQGFPGNLTVDVTYQVTEDNTMRISYHGVPDRKTVINMTNHCYFNLNGQESGDVLGQELMIHASHYTPLQKRGIPSGEIAAVEGTPFDFRTAKLIGRDIHSKDPQVAACDGYDHNFALDKTKEGQELAATAYAEESGIHMEVYTDCPGLQLYTANGLKGAKGKNGVTYPNYGAFCLEAQYFPNAINEPNFVSPLVDAGETYESSTSYHFFV